MATYACLSIVTKDQIRCQRLLLGSMIGSGLVTGKDISVGERSSTGIFLGWFTMGVVGSAKSLEDNGSKLAVTMGVGVITVAGAGRVGAGSVAPSFPKVVVADEVEVTLVGEVEAVTFGGASGALTPYALNCSNVINQAVLS